MKKLFALLCVSACMLASFAMASCSGENSDSSSYTITWKNGDEVIDTVAVEYGGTPVYNGETPVKAEDAQYVYTFKGWSPEITSVTGDATYTATFDGALKSYTITWKNGDEVIDTVAVEYGSTPEYKGETPVKDGDEQYVHIFKGWTPEITSVTGDATYTATFERKFRPYTITWKNGDEVIDTVTVEYGSTPVYNGETPVKDGDAQYVYTFKGWSPEVTSVTGDATYTATFDGELKSYTITWKNGDEVLDTVTVEYGSTPEYKGETPVKDEDEQHVYAFKGWTPEVKEVTGDATYSADWQITDKHLVVFIDAYGKETTQRVLSGNTVAPQEPIERTGYEFEGWFEVTDEGLAAEATDFENAVVDQDITFKAVYDAVGPLYEKPALVTENALISEKEYSFVQYGRDNDHPVSYSIESSAAVFADVGISDWKAISGNENTNTKFVVAATVKGGWTSAFTGFVFSTEDGKYLQLIIDRDNGIVLQSQNGVFTKGDGTPYGVWRSYLGKDETDELFDKTKDTRIAVKYDGNKNFIVYINGNEATSVNLRYSNVGDDASRRHYLAWGEGNTLRLGLNATNGLAVFTDWGYSTDEAEFSKYIWTLPVLEKDENPATITKGAYLIEGAEVENWNNGDHGNVKVNGDNWVNGGKQMNTKFSISATISADADEKNYKAGFVFTLNGSDYFAVLYNNEEKEIRIQASNGHYRDYGLGDTFDPAGTTMTLEYDGIQGMLLYFGEGENKKLVDLKNAFASGTVIFRFGYTKAADGGYGDNEHVTEALKESGGTLKAGLIVLDGTATFTDYSFNLIQQTPED